jgi:hypothetical protein
MALGQSAKWSGFHRFLLEGRHHCPTANPAAAGADTSIGPECSTRIAVRGNVPNPRYVPNVLTAYDAQSHLNDHPGDGPAMPGPFAASPE